MNTLSICQPCAAASQCYSCSRSNPAQCLNCFPGSFLTSNKTCQSCAFPCASCTNSSAQACSSCALGYVFSPNTQECFLVDDPIQNCANQYQVNADQIDCSLCYPGYAITPYGCTPCVRNCLVCSPWSLGTCQQCQKGWTLNSSYLCT